MDKPCEGEVDLGEVDLNDVEAEAEACMICVRVRCCILTTGSSEVVLMSLKVHSAKPSLEHSTPPTTPRSEGSED